MNSCLRSRRILTPSGIISGTISMSHGLIQDVLPYDVELSAAITDVGDKLVVPGVIDPHVHINEPGRTEWEGFETATKAALAGGITTLVDMPLNSSPVTVTVEAFDLKREAADGKLYTNCGFWGGVVPGYINEIPRLAKSGVLGFKAFLTHSGIEEFPNVTEADLRGALPLIKASGLPLLVHCELSDSKHHVTGDPRSYLNYLQSRPAKWETDAINLIIRLCNEYDCHIHIVHLSSAEALPWIVAAKKQGLKLTVETGQHYLYFNAENISDGQTQFKCAPPIRERANNDKLWTALVEGVIDFVATDHSPCTPTLKETGSGNFMKAWGGISSIQFALPVLWTAARARQIDFALVSKWLSVNPAKLIKKENLIGSIAKGYKADLIVFDEEAEFTVAEDMILHKHKLTPYLGERLYGVVEQTYLAGELVYDHGAFKSTNGKLVLADQ